MYRYLLDCRAKGDPAPTLAEVCAALGLRSRGSLHKHVQALVQAGLVLPLAGQRRGIQLCLPTSKDETVLPFLGYIAAGRPIEAVVQNEGISVPPSLCGNGPCYCLQVRGDSMIDDGILDGDWVVIEHRSHARNGEIVVALVDDEEATLKRIFQSPGKVTLTPANNALRPQVYAPHRITIQGAVVAQMRRYR